LFPTHRRRFGVNEMVLWSAKSILKLVGGVPGDDWSILPVHEVVETRYNVGGHTILLEPYVLTEF